MAKQIDITCPQCGCQDTKEWHFGLMSLDGNKNLQQGLATAVSADKDGLAPDHICPKCLCRFYTKPNKVETLGKVYEEKKLINGQYSMMAGKSLRDKKSKQDGYCGKCEKYNNDMMVFYMPPNSQGKIIHYCMDCFNKQFVIQEEVTTQK
jgi:hypothetical protein